MSRLLVNRCICYDKTFDEIKEITVSEGITKVSTLQEKDICANNCKLCEPYLELMFKTGETAFEPGAYLKQRIY